MRRTALARAAAATIVDGRVGSGEGRDGEEEVVAVNLYCSWVQRVCAGWGGPKTCQVRG